MKSDPLESRTGVHLPEQRSELLVGLILVLVTLAVFIRVYHFGFVTYDDPVYISQNSHVLSGWSGANLRWAFTSGDGGNWNPMVWISFLASVSIFGTDPGVHHLINVLLHLVNAILCFRLFCRMSGNLWASASLAFLFAIHPLHVESVAWISERKDVLSGLFWLWTTSAYFQYTEKPSVSRYGQVLLYFAMGLMSKPMLVTLPITLIFLDFWPLRRISFQERGHWFAEIRRAVLEKTPLFILSGVISGITLWLQSGFGAMASSTQLLLHHRLGNAAVSAVRYLTMMLWPTHLSVIYPHPGGAIPIWLVILALAMLILITAVVLLNHRKYPYGFVGWAWYLTTLLPVIGIVQVGSQAMADRYTYIPLIGPFIILIWGYQDLKSRVGFPEPFSNLLAGLIACGLVFATVHQVRYWRDSVSLFSHAIEVTNSNYVAHEQLGHAFREQGKFQEAFLEYTEAIRINPNIARLTFDLGDVLERMGRKTEALEQFQGALKKDPGEAPRISYRMACLLSETGNGAGSIPFFRTVIAADPNSLATDPIVAHGIALSSRINLGIVYRRLNLKEEAEWCFMEAIRFDPRSQVACINLGVTLSELGRDEEAVPYLRRALEIKPKQPTALYYLGLTLLKSGKRAEALAVFRDARDVSPHNPRILEQLRQLDN